MYDRRKYSKLLKDLVVILSHKEIAVDSEKIYSTSIIVTRKVARANAWACVVH